MDIALKAAKHHPVALAGLRAGRLEKHKPPVLVERRDQDFVAGLLAEVVRDDTRQALFAQRPPSEGGRLRLFQPIQRVFNLVVLEAYCDTPGQPRLDPAKIDSAGFVLRRVRGAKREAWIRSDTRIFGWDEVDEEVDPATDKRALARSLGNSHLDARLALRPAHLRAGAKNAEGEVNEHVVKLFTAPPEACRKAGKTVLFGVVPVTSSEQAERGAASPDYGADADERASLQQHLVHYLKAGSAKTLPRAGQTLSRTWAGETAASEEDKPEAGQLGRLGTFMLLLQQLAVEFDAFGESREAQAFRARLDAFQVERDTLVSGTLRTTREPAGAFLKQAAAILVDGKANGAGLTMPQRWAAVSSGDADQLFRASLACLNARFAAIQPAQGRFDDEDARYVLRAFLRLKPEHPGCPARLVWSEYSEEFTIAPWHESAGGVPATISLPDLFDASALKKLKPTVAFKLPPKLARLLKADPKKLRDGEGSGEGFELGWICSFSLPIITLCAFIVLNIFLQLFAMIFFWLPFLKICIPIPKKK